MPLDLAKGEAVSVVQLLFLFPQEEALSYFWVSRAKCRDSTVVTNRHLHRILAGGLLGKYTILQTSGFLGIEERTNLYIYI